MVRHLTFEMIKRIHDGAIDKGENPILERPEDVYFSIQLVKEELKSEDIYKQALGYCVSLIVLHPFKEGNHRTSLYTAIIFLMLNKEGQPPSTKKVKEIQE
jgi:prophage maintenance system killer protein